MPKQVIYPLKNDYIIKLSEKKEDQARGICVAASAMWCRGILTGVQMAGSQPNALVAYQKQSRYRAEVKQGGDEAAAKRHVLAGLGLDVEMACRKISTGEFLEFMRDAPGIYIGGEVFHTMAWYTDGAGLFYTFDIEQNGSLGGLIAYTTFNEWRDDMEVYYEEFDFWTAWRVLGLA